jgi:FtsZ-binding cell division protein ZapB
VKPCWYCNGEEPETKLCEACREREAWRQELDAAEGVIERLQAGNRRLAEKTAGLQSLIDALADAYNAMEPLRQDPNAEVWPLMNVWQDALHALLDNATPQEDDRG